jgi:tetratricopeptide (TPR) repeat protein
MSGDVADPSTPGAPSAATMARWPRVKEIVSQSLALDASERGAFIDTRCAGDVTLLADVKSLVRASEGSDAVLSRRTDPWLGVGGPAAPALVGARVGRYQLTRVIAEGGSAVVYEGMQTSPERRVAVKILRLALPLVNAADRFQMEAAALARVEHPNVARIYEAGVHRTESGAAVPFIAMEFVEGTTITAFARDKRLDHGAIVRLVHKACAGVSAAHQRAVIHRDLKPSNVLVDARGEPRVLDFGIARLDETPLRTWQTGVGDLLGTPGYMSPEQARGTGDDVDVRTDVWGLGAILYEMISGRLPIEIAKLTPLEALRAMGTREAMPLRRVTPAVSSDLETVVMTALAREPSRRYASVEAFADDLVRVLEDRPIWARRPTLVYRARKFVRRNTLGVGVAALLAAVGVGTTIGVWNAYARASVARDRAAAVNAILGQMLTSADPSFGNKNVTMLEVVGGLEGRIVQASAGQPLVEADVRSSIGWMFFGLGEYEKSAGHLRHAIALRERDGDVAALLTDRARLATVLRWLYKPDEAMAMAVAARGQALREFGPLHPVTLAAKEVVAGCLQDAQKLEEAQGEYESLVRDCERVLSPGDELVLSTRTGLASVMADRGQYARAVELTRSVLALRTQAGGGATRESLTLRGNLASWLVDLGSMDEGIAELRSLIEDSSRLLGPAHPGTITSRSNLVEILSRSGQTEAALVQARELVELCAGNFGWTHPLTQNACIDHATMLLRLKRYEEALTIAERATAESARALGPDDLGVHRHRQLVAGAYSGLGRHDEARALYESVIERMTALVGPEHRFTLIARNNAGLERVEAGDGAGAEAMLLPTLAKAREAGFEQIVSVVQRNLGRAILLQGRLDEAHRELAAAYERSVERGEQENAIKCAQAMVELARERGNAADVDLWEGRAGTAAKGQ